MKRFIFKQREQPKHLYLSVQECLCAILWICAALKSQLVSVDANTPPLHPPLGLVQPPQRSGDVPAVRGMRRGLPKAAGFGDGSLLTWRRRRRRRRFQSAESNNMSRNSFIQSQSINESMTHHRCSLKNSQIEYGSTKNTQN